VIEQEIPSAGGGVEDAESIAGRLAPEFWKVAAMEGASEVTNEARVPVPPERLMTPAPTTEAPAGTLTVELADRNKLAAAARLRLPMPESPALLMGLYPRWATTAPVANLTPAIVPSRIDVFVTALAAILGFVTAASANLIVLTARFARAVASMAPAATLATGNPRAAE
jgi:hypothetical protein